MRTGRTGTVSPPLASLTGPAQRVGLRGDGDHGIVKGYLERARQFAVRRSEGGRLRPGLRASGRLHGASHAGGLILEDPVPIPEPVRQSYRYRSADDLRYMTDADSEGLWQCSIYSVVSPRTIPRRCCSVPGHQFDLPLTWGGCELDGPAEGGSRGSEGQSAPWPLRTEVFSHWQRICIKFRGPVPRPDRRAVKLLAWGPRWAPPERSTPGGWG